MICNNIKHNNIYYIVYMWIYKTNISIHKWDNKNKHTLNKQQLFLYAFVKVVINNLKLCVYVSIVTTIKA